MPAKRKKKGEKKGGGKDGGRVGERGFEDAPFFYVF